MLANKQTMCRISMGFKKLWLLAIGKIRVYASKEHKRALVWWKAKL